MQTLNHDQVRLVDDAHTERLMQTLDRDVACFALPRRLASRIDENKPRPLLTLQNSFHALPVIPAARRQLAAIILQRDDVRIDAPPAALRDSRNRTRPTRGHGGQNDLRARSLHKRFGSGGVRRIASLGESRALYRQNPFGARTRERIGGILNLGADQSDDERTQLFRRSYSLERRLSEFGMQ